MPLKALFLVYKLKGGLPYNTDCFSYWHGTIQASYAVMRQLLFTLIVLLLIVLFCVDLFKVASMF